MVGVSRAPVVLLGKPAFRRMLAARGPPPLWKQPPVEGGACAATTSRATTIATS